MKEHKTLQAEEIYHQNITNQIKGVAEVPVPTKALVAEDMS